MRSGGLTWVFFCLFVFSGLHFPHPKASRLDSKETLACDEAIQSPMFWAYVQMVQRLTLVANQLLSKMQACPCHSAEERHLMQQQGTSCPNKGRWLPFLANGYLSTVATQLLAEAYASIVPRMHGLTAKQSAQILHDYECGRQHLLCHLRIKGAVHEDLPLVLMGLAHPDLLAARRVAQRSLEIWSALGFDAQQQAHSVTKLFLEPGGALRSQVQAFANSHHEKLEAWPLLFKVIHKSAMARVDEHDMDLS